MIYGNAGWWSEIADYCRLVAPDICNTCKYWYSNDGDGLNAAGAIALAKTLRARICDHHVDDYARKLAAKDASGDPFGSAAESAFAFLKKIAAFADFLENCGGFQIW